MKKFQEYIKIMVKFILNSIYLGKSFITLKIKQQFIRFLKFMITWDSDYVKVSEKYGKRISTPLSIFKHLESRFFRARLKLSSSFKLYKFTHDTFLETLWTIFPILVVLAIAIPSFILLYALDTALDTYVFIKAIGHQWYWSYECDYTNEAWGVLSDITSFDSYMIYDSKLKKGQLRVLEVDNPLYIPYKLPVDIIVTSVDVIHSWAVPSLGIKVDGVPGRLNHASLFLERDGVFYGQCSELCGVNHGFMPIKVISTPFQNYIQHLDPQPSIEFESSSPTSSENLSN